jgi:PAS domain S-box-containing protein
MKDPAKLPEEVIRPLCDGVPMAEVLDSAAGAFLWLDPGFRIRHMNSAAAHLLDKLPAEAAGCVLWELAGWTAGGEFERRHREAMSTRFALRFEHHCPEQDLWLDIRLSPSGDGGLFAWYRDTGAEHRTQSDLQRREEEYRTILRTTMDGFWIMDIRGRFLDVNDAYCRLIGFSREELLGMSIRDVDATETEEETRAHIRQVLELGYCRFIVKHRRKDGRLLDLEVSSNYFSELERFCVFLRDITERKRVENALRESENRYRIVAEHMQDVFYRTDMAGNILIVSPSGANLFGILDAQELVGKNILGEGIQDESEVREFFELMAANGEVREHEMHLRTKDGRLLEITTNSRFVFDENGKPVGVEGIFRDVTARKAAERENAARRPSCVSRRSWRASAGWPAASRTTSITS